MIMQRPYNYRFFLFLIFFVLLSVPVRADNVDDLILSKMAEHHIPGAAVAVVKNGKVVKIKGYGLASVEFQVPVTTETVFEIGSVSKQMTAAAIMLLVQDEKVDLDAKISKYLNGTPESWKDISVRNLLTHTSGIKSYTSLSGFELSNRWNVDQFIKKLSPYPLEFTPGEKNIYSNSAFNLLAFIVESVSKKPFMTFMSERIFTPLGMTHTTERDPQYIVMNRANGYEWNDGHLSGRDGNLTNLMGAGSIVSTISDMVKWDEALSGNKFLNDKSKKQIWTKFIFNDGSESPYGFGWRLSEVRGHKLIGHTGQTAGFGAANFRYVDDKVFVIALTNLGDLGMGGMLASTVAKIYIPSMSLRAMKGINDDNAELTRKSRNAFVSRLEEKPDAEIFSVNYLKTLERPRTLTETRRLAAFGKVQTFILIDKDSTGNNNGRIYKVEMGTRFLLLKFIIDNANRISSMSLEEEE